MTFSLIIIAAVIAIFAAVSAFTTTPPSSASSLNNNTTTSMMAPTSNATNNTATSSTNSSVLEVGAPGNAKNEYYIFTQELNADEKKLGVPVAVYTLTSITVHKGDNVTIHFYNTADEADDRHTFTMQDPYKMNIDLAGGQNKTFSFIANTTGGFTYYCTYDLPSMTGHLEVLP